MVTPDRTAVRGREEIGAILAQLIAAGAQVSIQVSAVLPAGDVALAHERWCLVRSDLSGGSLSQESSTTLVLQRVETGWKIAVAAPWGWGR